jgi:hypothetical protein
MRRNMTETRGCPIGRMHLHVRASGSVLIAERAARNIVLRQGAAVIAALFTGAAGAAPVNTIQVGFAKESATPELAALTPPADASIPATALRSSVAPADFKIVADRAESIQVLITSVFKPTVELAEVTEAGLLAGEKLYNQVVFEPVTLRPGQDVTFFWEIDFPFGR